MAVTSHLAAAEVGLMNLLEARKAIPGNPLADVPLDFGWPGDTLSDVHMWIGEEATSTQEWQTTGTGSQAKMETAVLEVWVWVTTPGNDYVASRDRGLEIAGEIEHALRDDFQLDGQVFDASVTRIRKAAAPADEARGLFLRVDVEFLAWLS
jgi:hypothetical protein